MMSVMSQRILQAVQTAWQQQGHQVPVVPSPHSLSKVAPRTKGRCLPILRRGSSEDMTLWTFYGSSLLCWVRTPFLWLGSMAAQQEQRITLEGIIVLCKSSSKTIYGVRTVCQAWPLVLEIHTSQVLSTQIKRDHFR